MITFHIFFLSIFLSNRQIICSFFNSLIVIKSVDKKSWFFLIGNSFQWLNAGREPASRTGGTMKYILCIAKLLIYKNVHFYKIHLLHGGIQFFNDFKCFVAVSFLIQEVNFIDLFSPLVLHALEHFQLFKPHIWGDFVQPQWNLQQCMCQFHFTKATMLLVSLINMSHYDFGDK